MEGKRRASAQCSPARAGTLEGECAREDGKGGSIRERMAEGEPGRGSPSLWSHRSPVCKEWCVCVCECARVRACVAVGGGVPGVLQHQTAPRGGKRIRNDGTTADRTLNPSPAGARAAPLAPSHGSLRSPPAPPRVQRPLPALGSGISFCPLALSTGRCGEQEPLCRLCGPTGRRLVLLGVWRSASSKGGRLSGGDVGDVMRASTQRLPRWRSVSRCPGLGNPTGAPGSLSHPPAGPRSPFIPQPCPRHMALWTLITPGRAARGSGYSRILPSPYPNTLDLVCAHQWSPSAQSDP